MFSIPLLAEPLMQSPSYSGRGRFVTLPFLFVIIASITVDSARAVAQDNNKEAATPPTAATETVPTGTTQPVDFAKDVFPILQTYCLECHGPEKQEQDFRVDQSESLLAEDYVTPGDGANSLLYEVLISEDDDRMPPPEEEMVVPEQDINTIKAWIDQGAKWSDISALIAAQPAAVQETESKASDLDPPKDDDQQSEAKTIKPAATKSNPGAARPPLSPQTEFWVKVWRAFGDLHPAAVHFPVALLVVGGVFALFGLRGSYRCSDFAFYCLWLGAISAIAASFVGWSYAWNEGHNEDPFLFDMQARLFWHRWTAVLLSLVSFLLAVWATIARRRDPDDGTIWKLGLIVMAGLTMYVGHAGGDLTHPRGYRRLYELMGIQDPAKPTAPRAFENNPPANASTDK